MKQELLNSSLVILFPMVLAGCHKSSFNPGIPNQNIDSPSSAPSVANSNLVVTSPIPADGKTPAIVTITLLSATQAPVSGVTLTITVSGTGNTVTPCTASNARGVSTCKIVSSWPETKTIQSWGAISMSQSVVFSTLRSPNTLMGITTSGASASASNGGKVISASGVVQGPLQMKDSGGTVRVLSSVLSVVNGN